MNTAQPTKVFMVRTLDVGGTLHSFRLFSSREKAQAHINQTPLPAEHKFSILEREATPQSVAPLVRAGH